MAESYSMWENLLLGVMALAIVFWFSPGIKAAIAKSKEVQTDWPSVLVPLALVVMFVVVLIAMV